ncbi:MAG: HD domain-containing protein [Planctomycetes bacterium]|nr:HD domain-containing protein [Planctomycetota bacterium]MBU1518066.1 HD domain-containing protein [Planctomycetota bacterium]MBU2458505.1 HD domain-containing protein [Planctomycetota bacterium]MBU2596007.1 HD domain-containing protein [Planctomycetota bacterium]
MRNCKIPTIEQCYELLKQCHVPKHIVRHCEATADFAVELAKRILRNGIKIDIDFVHRACLLHDIMRVCDFSKPIDDIFDEPITEKDREKWQQLSQRHKGLRHEDAACEFLKAEYPKIALAIKKHAYKSLLNEKLKPQTIEEKIVYYADKRVMHNKVVSLAERLEEGHSRNTCPAEEKTADIGYIDSLIFELEKELLSAGD